MEKVNISETLFMMKFLILSGDCGNDCDSVAAAVYDAAKNAGIECLIADPAVFSDDGIIAWQKLTDKLKKVRKKNKEQGRGVISEYFFSSNFIKNLNDCIESEGFDAVISADLKVTETLTGKETAAPFYAVLTDYTCPDIKQNAPFDTYFIPHESMRGELLAKNIPDSKISVFGFPVPLRFNKQRGKRAARNYLVIPEDRKVYLILASGMSEKNAEEICDDLLITESGDFSVYCLCGRDSDVRDALTERYRGNEKVQVVAYNDKVNIYMEAADVVLSRPVGIISAEAAITAVPLVHISPLTAKDKTADFFSSREMSLKGFDVRDAVKKAKRLLENSAVSDRMKMIQKKNCPSDSAEKIVSTISECLKKKVKT